MMMTATTASPATLSLVWSIAVDDEQPWAARVDSDLKMAFSRHTLKDMEMDSPLPLFSRCSISPPPLTVWPLEAKVVDAPFKAKNATASPHTYACAKREPLGSLPARPLHTLRRGFVIHLPSRGQSRRRVVVASLQQTNARTHTQQQQLLFLFLFYLQIQAPQRRRSFESFSRTSACGQILLSPPFFYFKLKKEKQKN